MTMTRTTIIGSFAAAALALSGAQSAFAGAHTWDIIEVFSNADGTIQFVELQEMNGTPGEVNVGGLKVTSTSTGQQFTFAGNVASPSTSKHILLGTKAFQALSGAPAVNGTLPNGFFNPAGDTLKYHVYDTWVIGAVPTDCVTSFNRTGGSLPNTPQNYTDPAGSVDCSTPPPPCLGDLVVNGEVDVDDLLVVINSWGRCKGCDADIAPEGGNGVVDVDDLLEVINNWGPCE